MQAKKKRMSEAWTLAAVIVGFAAVMLAIGFYMVRMKGNALDLKNANPGWTVEYMPHHAPLRVDDGSAAGEVFVNEEDGGAQKIARVDCAEARIAIPHWFVLPDAPFGPCIRLGNTAPFTYVINMRTAVGIPQIWDDHYAKASERPGWHPMVHWWSGRPTQEANENLMESDGSGVLAPAPNGARSNRYARRLQASIDPPERSLDPRIGVDAFYYGDATQVVFAFRPPRQP